MARPVTRAAVSAATSRAMPMTDMASPRFGVTLRSRTCSSRFRYSRRSCPTGASAGSSMIPSEASARRSSLGEHSMPWDSTPRSLAALMVTSPGSVAPTTASALFNPLRALLAPHTICTGSPLPVATRHSDSLSACGWRSQLTISATITPANGGAAGSSDSISMPAMVRRWPSSCAGHGTRTHSASQEYGTFMRRTPGTAGGTSGRSRRTASGHSRHSAASRAGRSRPRRRSRCSARGPPRRP